MALTAKVRQLTSQLGLDGKLTSLFYGNEFHPATGGTNVAVVSPLTGETLAESGGASDTDVGLAVDVSAASQTATPFARSERKEKERERERERERLR